MKVSRALAYCVSLACLLPASGLFGGQKGKALVRHAPRSTAPSMVTSTNDGESVALNGGTLVTGDWLVPECRKST